MQKTHKHAGGFDASYLKQESSDLEKLSQKNSLSHHQWEHRKVTTRY